MPLLFDGGRTCFVTPPICFALCYFVVWLWLSLYHCRAIQGGQTGVEAKSTPRLCFRSTAT